MPVFQQQKRRLRMPEKDEFTFDDNEDFPETDLSGIFADAEQQASEEQTPADKDDLFGRSEAVFEAGDGEESLPPIPPLQGAGSRSRILLLVLLLVVAAAAGAYYFMDLGDMGSEPPPPQKKSQQVVVVPPPKPIEAEAAAPAPSAEQPPDAANAGNVKMPDSSAAVGTAATSSAESATAEKSEREKSGEATLTASPAAADKTTAAEPAASAKLEVAVPAAVVAVPAPPASAATAPVPEPAAVAAKGSFMLDAGAFLFAAQREELKKKIRALGYEPVESQVKASVRLIRLRVGSFSKEQLPEALEKVRRIAPGAFSLARDGQHVVYAGSFADQNNVQRLLARFQEEGIPLVEEPVKVDRVLSLIRFGSFADEASAEQAAKKAEAAGIPARVVSN
jgi:cell division septation protein DedD